jgi:hypothetical protein
VGFSSLTRDANPGPKTTILAGTHRVVLLSGALQETKGIFKPLGGLKAPAG